jgi:hypothetical protein
MTRLLVAIAPALLIASASPTVAAWAQNPPPATARHVVDTTALTRGASVRLWTPALTRADATLRSRVRDTLSLHVFRTSLAAPADITLTLAQIDSIQVRQRTPGGAGEGVAIGLFAGAVIGVVAAPSKCGSLDVGNCASSKIGGAIIGGLLGAGLGWIVSSSSHATWTPVAIPDR